MAGACSRVGGEAGMAGMAASLGAGLGLGAGAGAAAAATEAVGVGAAAGTAPAAGSASGGTTEIPMATVPATTAIQGSGLRRLTAGRVVAALSPRPPAAPPR